MIEPVPKQGQGGRMKRRGLISIVIVIATILAFGIFAFGCGSTTTTTTPAVTTTTAAGATTTAGSETTTTSGSAEELVIGAALGLTGDAAAGDVPASEAMEYAVDTLNAADGIAGHPVKLIIKDMKSDPALGAAVAKELLDEGAQIIIGPAFPGMAAGVIQTAAAKNVTVMAATSTQPEYVSVGGVKAYLVAFGDNVQAAAMAEYATKQGYKTVYTLVSPDLSYTAKLPVFFKETFEKAGGKEVGTDTFSIGQTDFAPQVTKIASLDPQPDCIYTGMFPPDVGIFIKQLRAAGVKSHILGADGLDQQPLIDFAGADAEGVTFSTHGYPTPGSAFAQFVEGMTKANGHAPEAPALATTGGDVIEVIKAAVEAAGSVDPKALGEAVGNLQNVKVINGVISYKGTDGVPQKTVSIVAVEGGKFVLKDQFLPAFVPTP
jgi:branched-chain amino acid transport system substrate-binding protein